MNAIIILSGGLDSSVVAYQVKSQNPDKIKCIFYDYNQRTKEQEEFAARKIAENIQAKFIKVDIPWLGKISTSMINSKEEVEKTTEEDRKKAVLLTGQIEEIEEFIYKVHPRRETDKMNNDRNNLFQKPF